MEGGGSYIIQADGTRLRAEEATRPHPAGDAPRTAAGLLIGADGRPVATPSPAPGPAPRQRRARLSAPPATEAPAPTTPAPEPQEA